MADYCGNLADIADFVGRVEEISQDETCSYTSPLRPILIDRQNLIEAYGDAGSLSRYRFLKRAVLRLLEMLPLGPNDDERGHPVPPLHAD
ncbi:hypothetical protein HPB52_016450 [Rhipicephalus sanguineus]|uniref:Uncharacterized protein n=1 Tax=Rhipicephalus sanguineus TaxID=34632 RepID=A0A9D4YQH0_RHISA|nr:hypothetical protein HPB52_016450 [Rhipicephalus sanguineus]